MEHTETDVETQWFRNVLVNWFRSHGRTFPWRSDTRPYALAMAELMLRRTRADQAAGVYNRFLEENPTLEVAAARSPDYLRQMLAPLGLSWRIENIVEFIQAAHNLHGCHLPTDRAQLLALPGIGDYVAAAVGCFAAGDTAPLIDTNVVRVLGRVFGLDISGEARRRRSFRDFAAHIVPRDNPAEYHYALLDFAALVCTARGPKCGTCPLATRCEYAIAYANQVRKLEEPS